MNDPVEEHVGRHEPGELRRSRLEPRILLGARHALDAEALLLGDERERRVLELVARAEQLDGVRAELAEPALRLRSRFDRLEQRGPVEVDARERLVGQTAHRLFEGVAVRQ